MKKFLMALMLLTMVMVMVAVPLAMAEASDAVPVEPGTGIPGMDQLLTKEVLASMLGMVLAAGLLTQGIKIAFMRKATVESIRIMALIVAAVVVVVAKLIFTPQFEIADIIIIPGNTVIVWLAAMKAYEKTVGVDITPAG